jgi:hypothetical protein
MSIGAQDAFEPAERSPVPTGVGGRSGANTHAPRSLPVGAAAQCGALLGGLVALIRGALALAGLGVHLERAGFFVTLARGVQYAGRSLLGLLVITVLAAALGGITWATGALIYNRVAITRGAINSPSE